MKVQYYVQDGNLMKASCPLKGGRKVEKQRGIETFHPSTEQCGTMREGKRVERMKLSYRQNSETWSVSLAQV